MMAGRIAKKRSPNWADNEVNLLMEVWKDNKKKLEIHRGKRNIKEIYEEISAELAEFYCYRTAEEVSTKIENMSKRFRYERTKELETGTKSEWRFYWPVDDILGNNPTYCVEYIRDSIKKKAEEEKIKKEDNRATILMFKHPDEQKEILEGEVSAHSPQTNSMDMSDCLCDDESLTDSQGSRKTANTETKDTKGQILENLLQDYKETKQSLQDTDQKILELLSNQNDLIKTQNALCETQNAILKTLLEKME